MQTTLIYRRNDEFPESDERDSCDFEVAECLGEFGTQNCDSLKPANLRTAQVVRTSRVVRTFGPKVESERPTVKYRKPGEREKCIYTWIRNRTSDLDCGVMIDSDDDRHPIHLNKNQRVLEHFECLRRGERSWLTKLKNQNFIDHRHGVETFYFAGQGRSKNPETLVLLDIDCKKFGSLFGARAFAGHLKEHHFDNLYFEDSTNGKGVHGYFVLQKWDNGAHHINDLLLHRLQPWLRQIMVEQGFDVENIEVKGTLPVIEWGEELRQVTNYKSGTLAKLPRIPTQKDEEALRNTALWTINELRALPIVETPKKRSASPTTARPVAGSITGKHIGDDEIRHVDGHYRMVAETLMETHALPTDGRTVATVQDLAIFLMLLKFFTNNMNPDGTLPTKRWREMWKAVFEAGEINRAFDAQRFTTLRNHLSKLGLLDWQDENFTIGWTDEDGKYHKGKASKWKASEELMVRLKLPCAVTETDNEEREGRTPFIRTTLIEFFRSITDQSEDEAIRPVLTDADAPLRLNPDEINRFITPFEAYTGLAA